VREKRRGVDWDRLEKDMKEKREESREK